MRTLEQIDEGIREQQAKIDAAYWNFIHTAQGKPPVLVVPDAYRIRNELREQRFAIMRRDRIE